MSKNARERMAAKLAKKQDEESGYNSLSQAANKAFVAYNESANQYLRDGKEENLQAAALRAVLYEGLINKISQIPGKNPVPAFRVLQSVILAEADKKKVFKLTCEIFKKMHSQLQQCPEQEQKERLAPVMDWSPLVLQDINRDKSDETYEFILQQTIALRNYFFENELSQFGNFYILGLLQQSSARLLLKPRNVVAIFRDNFDILCRKFETIRWNPLAYKSYHNLYYNFARAIVSPSSYSNVDDCRFALIAIRKFNEVNKYQDRDGLLVELSALLNLDQFSDIENLCEHFTLEERRRVQYAVHFMQGNRSAAREVARNIEWGRNDHEILSFLFNNILKSDKVVNLKKVLEISLRANINSEVLDYMKIHYFAKIGAYEKALKILQTYQGIPLDPRLVADIYRNVGQFEQALKVISEAEKAGDVSGELVNIKALVLDGLRRDEDIKKEFWPSVRNIATDNKTVAIKVLARSLVRMGDKETLQIIIKEELPKLKDDYDKLQILLYAEENEECIKLLKKIIANASEGHELYGFDLSQYDFWTVSKCIMLGSFEDIDSMAVDIEISIRIEGTSQKTNVSSKEDSVVTWVLPNGASIKSSDSRIIYNDRLKKYFYLTGEPDMEYVRAIRENGRELMHRFDENYVNIRPGGSGSDHRALGLKVGGDLFVVGAYGKHKNLERSRLPTPEQFVNRYLGEFELRPDDGSPKAARGAAAAL